MLLNIIAFQRWTTLPLFGVGLPNEQPANSQFFLKLNHRWPCSKFDHGQYGATFQYRDLYKRGKKITTFRLRTSRRLTCVSPSFFIPVNLIRSFQKYKMIYFVHNYFHLVIFHRLFDHLVQWITLDITKRR